jgi:parallel beta-helix repeat protein
MRTLLVTLALTATAVSACACSSEPSSQSVSSAPPIETRTSAPTTSVSPKTYDIAASDSTEKAKSESTLVCGGNADERVINRVLRSKAGGEVRLADGTYKISGGIIVPANTALVGQSWETKICRTSGDSRATLSKSINREDVELAVTDGSYFTAGQTLWFESEYVYVLAVVGNSLRVIRGHNGTDPLQHPAGAKLYFWMEVIRNEKSQEGGASGVRIANLFVDAGASLGLRCSQGITIRKCDDCLIDRCFVRNVSGGSYPEYSDTDWLRGGCIQADNSDRVVIMNCSVTKASHAGISLRNACTQCTVRNNEVWEVGYEGIVVGNKTFADYTSEDTIGEGCSDIVISDNSVRDVGMLGGSRGIFVEDQTSKGAGNPNLRITVSNNRVAQNLAECRMGGISITRQEGTSESPWDFRIEGNSVEGCVLGGISVRRVSGGKIGGNTVMRSGFSGISLANASEIEVLSNTSRDNADYGLSVVESKGVRSSLNRYTANLKGDVFISRNSTVIGEAQK